MSYDVIIWPGANPAGEDEADALYEEYAERHEELEENEVAPTPEVLAVRDDLVRLWPDDDWNAPEFPWSMAPVSPGAAAGDIAYLTMTVHSRLEEMVGDIGRIAREHGMVAYDPQLGEVVS